MIAGGESEFSEFWGCWVVKLAKASLAHDRVSLVSDFVNVTPDDIEKQNLRLKRDINKTFQLASEFCMVDCLCRARTREMTNVR